MSSFGASTDKFKACSYLLMIGGALAVYAYKRIQNKTKIRNLAKQKISSASAGSLEMEAVAWPFRNINTNLAGIPIVFRAINIQKLVRRGKNSKWETVWSKMTTTPFLAFDSTGYVLVNPNEEHFQMESIAQTMHSPGHISPLGLESFNDFYDRSLDDFTVDTKPNTGLLTKVGIELFNRYRIIERSIPIGSPLLIHGHYSPEDSQRFINLKDDYKLFHQRANKLLSEKGYRQSMMDKNKDGTVDLQELCHGFNMALKSSVKTEFSITDIKSVGSNHERLRGTIQGVPDYELMLVCGLEEQILTDQPIWRDWALLYLGGGIVALAILFILIL